MNYTVYRRGADGKWRMTSQTEFYQDAEKVAKGYADAYITSRDGGAVVFRKGQVA